MIKVIKSGISAEAAADMDAKVKATVETILADIDTRGDAAVRELSEKFDKWSPKSFRLSAEEIQAAVDRLPEQTIDDIKFAQAQIRKFATRGVDPTTEGLRFYLDFDKVTAEGNGAQLTELTGNHTLTFNGSSTTPVVEDCP